MSATVGAAPNTYRAFKNADKPEEVRRSNMTASKAVSDAVRTSLGPKGMDKMVRVLRSRTYVSRFRPLRARSLSPTMVQRSYATWPLCIRQRAWYVARAAYN